MQQEKTQNQITADKLYFRLHHEKLLNGSELVLSCLNDMDSFRETWLTIDRLLLPIELSDSRPCISFMATRFRLLEYLLVNASSRISAPHCKQLGFAVWTGLTSSFFKRHVKRWIPVVSKKQKNIGFTMLDRGTGDAPRALAGGMLSNAKEQKKLFKQHQGDTWTCLTLYAVGEIDQNEQAKTQESFLAGHLHENEVRFGALCGLLRTNGLGLKEKKLEKLNAIEAALEKAKADKNEKEKEE